MLEVGGSGLDRRALEHRLAALVRRLRAPSALLPPPAGAESSPVGAAPPPVGRLRRLLRAGFGLPLVGRPARSLWRCLRALARPAGASAPVIPAAPADAEPCHILLLGARPARTRRDPVVHLLAALQRLQRDPVHLHLVGWRAGPRRRQRYHARLRRLGLAERIHLPPADDPDRATAVVDAPLLLCIAAPRRARAAVRAALRADRPVIGRAGHRLRRWLKGSGLLLKTRDPQFLAAAAASVLEDPWLRVALRTAQRRALGQRAALDIRIEGPFDSSYSLAQVNGEMGRALARRGHVVGLHATEGPGDYPADPEFLEHRPELAILHRAAFEIPTARIVLRNLYPPRVTGMHGLLRGLNAYGWEESEFPPEWVDAFNRHLDCITVMSSCVQRLLIDAGVRLPIYNVGLGADHILRWAPEAPDFDPGEGFRFLHISSALPRKGVDVLLRAYARAFSRSDPVTLILKTHPNPHHDIEAEVAAWRARHPDAARVRLINRELDPGRIRWLYQHCHALVAPSRGEGFGLPLAEAMLHDLPVITTDHGGAREFCDADTAWLVAARCAPARSHFGLFGSWWAEPDPDDLARQLRAVYSAAPEQRAARTARARARVQDDFTWSATAQRMEAALQQFRAGEPRAEPPRVGWVSTYNSACGIAEYSRYLLGQWPDDRVTIYANHDAEPLAPDPPGVRRVWARKPVDPDLSALEAALREDAIDVLFIQFNFGFFALDRLAALLDACHRRALPVALILHSTADVEDAAGRISLRDQRATLARVQRLYVHGLADLQYLRDIGLGQPATRLPHGAPAPLQAAPPVQTGLLATFGFLLPHKGLVELVEALALLRRGPAPRPDLRLLMLNSLHPDPQSQAEHARLVARIRALGLKDQVELVTAHLSEREILTRLATAEWVVFPYQDTRESSSAAARLGLASGRPVACTPQPIFADLQDAVRRLPGAAPDALARGLAQCLGAQPVAGVPARQRAWLAAHAWPRVATRLIAWRDHAQRARGQPEPDGHSLVCHARSVTLTARGERP